MGLPGLEPGTSSYRLDRGFLVAAGLAECLEFLERFGFSADDLDWLEANLGLDPATLDAFAKLGFTGDVWAVPEGRVVLAGEPLLWWRLPACWERLVEVRGPASRGDRRAAFGFGLDRGQRGGDGLLPAACYQLAPPLPRQPEVGAVSPE